MIRYNPNINEGLNKDQIQYRKKYNYVNKISNIKVDSIYKIIFNNTLNLFNLLNLYMAVLFLINKFYIGIVFILIILFNTLINIIVCTRIKVTVDRLNKNRSNIVNVIRDSKVISINKSDVVLDDIIIYKENSDIVTDSIILEGNSLVDESILNGRNPVIKSTGDMLYSGSKVISGRCICRADKVGDNNYISKIINIVKDRNNNSFIKRILDYIIKYVSILVLIISIIIYVHTKSLKTVAFYTYKLVPVELVLFTTISFLISFIRLNKKKVLVRNLSSIENIKDIDTICFDKTGTLTSNNLVIDKVVVLNKKYDYKDILNGIGKYCNKSNKIIDAINKKYNKKTSYTFISEDVIDNTIEIRFKESIYILEESNMTVLLKKGRTTIAQLFLSNGIKENTKELISNIYKNNIDIKIISGDSKDAILNICKNIGIKKIKSIDMSVNNTNMNHQIVEEYNIFYNVSTEQKKILINALKGNKRNVAMVGDGINDILGLSAANSSISINNGDLESMKVSDYAILSDRIDCINDIINNSIISTNAILKIMYLCLFKLIYTFLLNITLFVLNINSLKFNYIYELIFLIPIILIVMIKDKTRVNIGFVDILNKSIIISFITYFLTIFTLVLNIDTLKLILLLISSIEFIALLKFNLLNKFLSILLLIIGFSCIIIL